MPNETETVPPPHLVYEGLKPLDLKPGDVVLKVDQRADGALCCLTVLRTVEQT